VCRGRREEPCCFSITANLRKDSSEQVVPRGVVGRELDGSPRGFGRVLPPAKILESLGVLPPGGGIKRMALGQRDRTTELLLKIHDFDWHQSACLSGIVALSRVLLRSCLGATWCDAITHAALEQHQRSRRPTPAAPGPTASRDSACSTARWRRPINSAAVAW